MKPTGMYLRDWNKIYGRTEGDRKDETDTTTPVVGELLFCYKGDKYTGNESKKRQH